MAGDVLGRRPRERGERAGALDHGAASVAPQAPRRVPHAGACLGAVLRHGLLGGMGRRRARHGRDVVDQGAIRVVADRGDHRDRQERDRAAQRLVTESEQIGQRAAPAGHDDRVHLAARREVAECAGDRRRGVPVLYRREGPDQPPRPAAAAQPGEHVVAGLAALARHDADRPRHRRASQLLLRFEQTLGGQLLAQPVELSQQVAFAGHPQLRHPEGEVRRGLRAARVVVATARHDHPGAVDQRLGPQIERLELVPPHRARHRAAPVAELEVDARAARAEVPHLAEQLHAGERAQPIAQLRRVGADRERARQPHPGNARRAPRRVLAALSQPPGRRPRSRRRPVRARPPSCRPWGRR